MRFILCLVALAGLAAEPPANARNEAAVREVLNGQRQEANAAWWGFDAEDSTAVLQAAIDSRAARVIVPYMGRPWVVRPITLRSNQEILFEPGVVILARKGEFRGGGDSLFTATGQDNITIRGYGATLRMHKADYQQPPYSKAEWRMGIALRGCRNVRIEGVRVESTGGDGFYIDGGAGRNWSQDVVIRDCVAFGNHRQGISVISVVNLLVENCLLANTRGTAPEAGIDLEPDSANQRLVNCVIRNCRFENNNGNAMLVHLKPLDATSEPVSIRFENCLARMDAPDGGWSGISVGAVRDNGPKGLIEFRNCTTEGTGKEGVRVYDKSADGPLVRFVQCHWTRPWISPHPEYKGPRVPVLMQLRNPDVTKRFGGVEFTDCYFHGAVEGPVFDVDEQRGEYGVHNLRGRIYAPDARVPEARMGRAPVNCDLKVVELVFRGDGK